MNYMGGLALQRAYNNQLIMTDIMETMLFHIVDLVGNHLKSFIFTLFLTYVRIM